MKIRLCLGLLVSSLAFNAYGSQILVNGGFETGSFTGWTVTGGANGDFYIDGTDASTPLTGNPTIGPYAGSYYAVTDDYGAETIALTQSFTDPVGTTSAMLSFEMFVNDWNGGSGTGGEVDLLASGADLITGTPIAVFASADTTVAAGEPNPYVAFGPTNIASDMTPGGTYILRVLESDSTGLINVGVDAFALNVTTSAVPEPGMFLPLALLTAGFAIQRRRRKA